MMNQTVKDVRDQNAFKPGEKVISISMDDTFEVVSLDDETFKAAPMYEDFRRVILDNPRQFTLVKNTVSNVTGFLVLETHSLRLYSVWLRVSCSGCGILRAFTTKEEALSEVRSNCATLVEVVLGDTEGVSYQEVI